MPTVTNVKFSAHFTESLRYRPPITSHNAHRLGYVTH